MQFRLQVSETGSLMHRITSLHLKCRIFSYVNSSIRPTHKLPIGSIQTSLKIVILIIRFGAHMRRWWFSTIKPIRLTLIQLSDRLSGKLTFFTSYQILCRLMEDFLTFIIWNYFTYFYVISALDISLIYAVRGWIFLLYWLLVVHCFVVRWFNCSIRFHIPLCLSTRRLETRFVFGFASLLSLRSLETIELCRQSSSITRRQFQQVHISAHFIVCSSSVQAQSQIGILVRFCVLFLYFQFSYFITFSFHRISSASFLPFFRHHCFILLLLCTQLVAWSQEFDWCIFIKMFDYILIIFGKIDSHVCKLVNSWLDIFKSILSRLVCQPFEGLRNRITS